MWHSTGQPLSGAYHRCRQGVQLKSQDRHKAPAAHTQERHP